MKTALRFIVALSFILGIATLVVTCIIEEDPVFKNYIESYIVNAIKTAGACDFTASVKRVRILSGFVELTHCQAKSKEPQAWNWSSEKAYCSISLFNFLAKKQLVTTIILHDIKINSHIINNEPAIINHIKAFIYAPQSTTTFFLKRLRLHQTACTLIHDNGTAHLNFDGELLAPTNSHQPYLLKTFVVQGDLTIKNVNLLSQLEGTIESELSYQQAKTVFHGSCNLQQLPTDSHCSFYGNLQNGEGVAAITTDARAIHADLVMSSSRNTASLKAAVPLDYLTQFAPKNTPLPLQGSCTISASTKLSDPLHSLQASLSVDNGSYGVLGLPKIDASIGFIEHKITGKLQATFARHITAQGKYSIDLQQKNGSVTIVTTTPIDLADQWVIPKKSLKMSLTVYHDGDVSGTYTTKFSHPTKSTLDVTGIFNWTPEHLIIQGNSEHFYYDFLAASKPHWHLEYCDCYLDKEPIMTLKAENNDFFSGTIGYHIVQLLVHSAGFHVPGEGNLNIRGSVSTQQLYLDLNMQKGNIHLPFTYNLLQDISAKLRYDIPTKTCSIDDIKLQLHKGTMTCSHILGILNDDFKLSYLHIPLVMHNCFLSHKKDFFALFSGALNLTYQINKKAQLSGFIVLDRSYIQSNIFSDEFRKQMFGVTTTPFLFSGLDLNCNVHLMTRSPLRVKTSFLEASASANLGVKGAITSPSIGGGVEIIHGTFSFPFKPLLIKLGKIYFLPQQTDDPRIEIIAENTLKKFNVRMNVSGSIKTPKISFEASPPLQEEQIISLLLGGSEEGSLYLAMPSSIMDSIENMLFGPAASTSKFQNTLQAIFSPLKSIHFVPNFSDQSGRGGLRGDLAIELNDRLRALIKPNFSLTEDTELEVEYDLSDDACARAIKDERGDLGGELEARWRF